MGKMVAVIPACAGGSGLPNKNIRLIKNRPLIYYVIQTARQCAYISDIVVTTNSDVIISIANQMGVRVRKRKAELCSRDVSLEAVIYDALAAFSDIDFDYVVTLQSISPTLRVETLNAAIEEYLHSDCDSMVSVVNKPFFFWFGNKEQPRPLYSERINRHLLPPFYQEVGAFQITRKACVTPESRWGMKTRLYELTDMESMDVNTFGDLKQVESILMKKRVAFYVNGNHSIGLGHIYRVLELADEFDSKPDIYYDIRKTDPAVFGVSPHKIIPVDGEEQLIRYLKEKQYHIFISDILSTTEMYMMAVRQALPQAMLINFEDDGPGARMADAVINALYEKSELSNVYTGVPYFIASKLFLMYEPISIAERVRHVLVTFGGADPNHYTEMMLSLAGLPEFSDLQFIFVIGRAKSNAAQLLSMQRARNIDMVFDTQNMAELMSRTDIAVTSRGRTGYELTLMGVPALSLAQNAREEMHTFLRRENGIIFLGRQPAEENVLSTFRHFARSSREERLAIQRQLLAHDLRHGREHVLCLIQNYFDGRSNS